MQEKDKQENNNQFNYGARSLDTNLSVSPFGQNRVAEIAYTKTERLVLATHLVTNFVPENEPVRKNVRESSQQLLPAVLALREGLRSAGPDHISDVAAEVRHILSLLDILHASGFVSNMNLDVLKSAYADLIRFLRRSEDGERAESLELEDAYFMSTVSETQPKISQGQPKGHLISVKGTPKKDIVKDTKVSGKIKDTEKQSTSRSRSVRTKRRAASRRMAILDVVTKQGPVFIKDISAEVTDCSEKTIQRELAGLINDGVVKKEGEKRWTTYALVV